MLQEEKSQYGWVAAEQVWFSKSLHPVQTQKNHTRFPLTLDSGCGMTVLSMQAKEGGLMLLKESYLGVKRSYNYCPWMTMESPCYHFVLWFHCINPENSLWASPWTQHCAEGSACKTDSTDVEETAGTLLCSLVCLLLFCLAGPCKPWGSNCETLWFCDFPFV